MPLDTIAEMDRVDGAIIGDVPRLGELPIDLGEVDIVKHQFGEIRFKPGETGGRGQGIEAFWASTWSGIECAGHGAATTGGWSRLPGETAHRGEQHRQNNCKRSNDAGAVSVPMLRHVSLLSRLTFRVRSVIDPSNAGWFAMP